MHVGDVITVNVSVAASTAKMQNTTSRARTNSDDANMTNFFGLEKVMPPVMDPSSLDQDGLGQFNVGTGLIQRQESDQRMTLAALVAQVLPNGNLVIDGHQQVRVNNELRDMRLSGIVRREDITQDNTVNLSQIAEARVAYGGAGTMSAFTCAAAQPWQPAHRHSYAVLTSQPERKRPGRKTGPFFIQSSR